MAGIPLRELKNKHLGREIWVIASGPSAGYVDPGFFEEKITIGVNRVWGCFKTTYLVVKESAVLQEAIDSGAQVIASRYNCATLSGSESKAEGDWYIFDHRNNGIEGVELDVIGSESDEIVVSFSTITSAMHVAAYMGARNILLVGHDCGTLDGLLNYRGYPENLMRSDDFYRDFLSRIEPQSLRVRNRLEQVYGCRIYSLNPFLNFGLEGHRYES